MKCGVKAARDIERAVRVLFGERKCVMKKFEIFNKSLRSEYRTIATFILAIASVIFCIYPEILHGDICNRSKTLLYLLLLIVLVSLIRYYCLSCLLEKKVKVRNTNIIVKFGDFWKEKGLKIVNFNEYFDTEVDEQIISSNTLNGQILKNKEYVSDISFFDKEIEANLDCKRNIVGENKNRANGKKIKYKLGTCFRYKERFVAVAFTKFNDENHAFLEVEDYLYCLVNFWKNLYLVYNGEKEIVVPLLGSGITRGLGSLSNQDKLKMLIYTLEKSCVDFSNTTIKIILYEEDNSLKNEISLFDVKEE